MPKSNMRRAMVARSRPERSQPPVNTPIKVVAMAGMVWMIPSGSRLPL